MRILPSAADFYKQFGPRSGPILIWIQTTLKEYFEHIKMEEKSDDKEKISRWRANSWLKL